MKAKEVMNILGITRVTLSSYVKQKYIKYTELPTGLYNYDEQSVWEFLSKKKNRHNYIYARVSTNKQKKDLENQIETASFFCNKNAIKIEKIYKDIGSGVHFERDNFITLFNKVLEGKVNIIVITYKDRLSRLAFPLLKKTFERMGTQIIVLDEIDSTKTAEKELFEDLISVIHSFSMKLYSARRKKKLDLIGKDLELEQELEE